MLGRLLLLFLLVPIIEVVLLVQVGQAIGLWPTLALVVATGFAGATLARSQGMRALARLRADLAAGRVPGEAALDGLAILLGGALLLAPGVLTDLTGILLLIPTTRRWIQRRLRGWLLRQVGAGNLRVSVLGGGWPFGGGTPGGPRGGAARPHRLDPRNEIEQREDEQP